MDADRWQQILRLYEAVSAISNEDRDAFLEEVCAGDDELRHELEALLACDAPTGKFLKVPAAATLSKPTPPESDMRPGLLEAGTTLGTYRIERLLGRGGMGAVFLAYDTTLHRRVALKVIEPTADAETLRTRILREARSAAALNHPNICTIYEVGHADSVTFIAMEYVEGRSLRDRLDVGPLPIDEAVRYGVQAADALAYAHDHGVVHRDFKAANVIVTETGHLKVIDFGLARRADAMIAAASTMRSIVAAGTLAGTPYAMAPEQVRGDATDGRTDVWALGVLLYEMVTGAHPFTAATVPELFSSILRDSPAWHAAVSIEIRTVIERCLEKEPGQRLQTAAEVYAALEIVGSDVRRTPAIAVAAPSVAVLPLQSMNDLVADLEQARQSAAGDALPRIAPAAARRRRMVLAGVIAGVVISVGVFGWRLWRQDYFWRNPLDGALVQRLTDFPGDEIDAAISPDGKFVSFLSDRGGPFDTWISPTGTGEFINVTKGRFPAIFPGPIRYAGFSGDSSQLWFLEQISLRPNRLRTWLASVVPTEPHPFLEAGMNPAWSPDGTRIVYHTPDAGDPIFIADRNGNNARQVYVDKPGIHNHYPTWSPDGRFVYFVKGVVTTDEMDLWRFAVPADGATAVPEQISRHNSRVAYPAWLDSRTLIYSATATDGAGQWLYAMDVGNRIPHRVSSGIAEHYLSVAVTADTRRLVATVAMPLANLWNVPVSGRMEAEPSVRSFAAPNARALGPRFGPDYLLFLSTKGGPDGLWKMSGGVARELWRGSEGGLIAPPAISPDGTQIAFAYRTQGRSKLSLMSANGTNVRTLTDALDIRGSFSWSPDGQWIALAGASSVQATRIYKISVSGGSPMPLASAISSRPLWSPDGTFIVYSEPVQGARMQAKAVTPEGRPFPLPEVWVNYQTGSPYRFVPRTNALIYLREGDVRYQNFFWIDLMSGQERQITNFRSGFEIRDFDVAPNGSEILFDRLRDNSDVVLMDIPR